MPFLNFSDFKRRTGDELLPTDFLVGYRDLVSEFRTTIADLTIEILKNLDLQTAPEVLYVNPAGRDTNTGRSEFNAFRTIKRACAKALEISRETMTDSAKLLETRTGVWGIGSRQVNIFVRTGDYIEDNPIYLPPSCTIIGDNLRSTTIIPKNKFFDIIWVNNRCYVWGVTFRKHKRPSFAIAYPSLDYIGENESRDLYYDSDTGVYPGTRIQNAITKATEFFNLYQIDNRLYEDYRPTYRTGINNRNLSEDIQENGGQILDPLEIAFLSRYFLNLNTKFFNNEIPFLEIEENKNFNETQWYKKNVRKPYQVTSPYTQGCSSITQPTTPGKDDGGGGIIVDGERVNGPLRSMVTDSFTQFNEGGTGIYITNNGYAQLVSTFTICCTEGVKVDNGGTCSINTSNCSFGLSGLVAAGKSPRPVLIGELKEDIDPITNVVSITRIGADIYKTPTFGWDIDFIDNIQPYPGHVFEIRLAGTGEIINNSGTLFTIISSRKVDKELSKSVNNLGIPLPGGGYDCVVELEQNYLFSLDSSYENSSLFANQQKIPKGSFVYFYIRSTITTSSHTMEYIGTGTTLLSAVPQSGGLPLIDNESIFDDVGRVFFTSTNHLGDFRVGRDLTIVQSTGTIVGETFERSILQITTPIALSLV
jgi:hypothetical protein